MRLVEQDILLDIYLHYKCSSDGLKTEPCNKLKLAAGPRRDLHTENARARPILILIETITKIDPRAVV